MLLRGWLTYTSPQMSHFAYEHYRYENGVSRFHDDVVMHNNHNIRDLGSGTPWAAVLTDKEATAQSRKVRDFVSGKPANKTCGLCTWHDMRKTTEVVTLHIKHM